MANHKSALKAHRQSLVRKERNFSRKTRVKTFIKKFEALVASGNASEASAFLGKIDSEIMKAVTKGIYKLNTASRKVSRLAKKLKDSQDTATSS